MDITSVLIGSAAEKRVMGALNYIFENAMGADDLEQRSEVRTPFFGPVTLTPEGAEHTRFSAFARDLSRSGIGLVHIMPLACGELIVRIGLSNGDEIALKTQITWCRNYGDGWYASGGRFVDVA